MDRLKEFIIELCSVMSVSGFEKRGTDELIRLTGGMLYAPCVDGVGNHLFVKKCGRENAP